MTDRQTILILGMHRSGTSALAGLTHLLGAAPPAGMMDAAFDNPTGFWESFPVTAFNESIFQLLGHHWFDGLTFDSANLDAAARSEITAQCVALLRQEFADAPFFVLKDPRLSLLLDLWLPAFAALNIKVIPVLALRHPAEVTASLRRRDNMPIEIAAPMWLHYTLEAERLTRGRPRAVVSYDRLLDDPGGTLGRVAAKTGLHWPVEPGAAAAAVGDFLRPHMRHHHAAPNRVTVGRPPVTGWIADAWHALRRIEDGAGTPQHDSLDRVHADFAAWRATASRISIAAAAGQEPITISTTAATTSASPATSPGRSDSFR